MTLSGDGVKISALPETAPNPAAWVASVPANLAPPTSRMQMGLLCFKAPWPLHRVTSVGQNNYGCYAPSVDKHFFFDNSSSGKIHVFDGGSHKQIVQLTDAAFTSPRAVCYLPTVDRVAMMDASGNITTFHPDTYAVDIDNVSPWSGTFSGGGQLLWNESDGLLYCSQGVTGGNYTIRGINPATAANVRTWTVGDGTATPALKDCAMAIGTDGLVYLIGTNSANKVSRLNADGSVTYLFAAVGDYGSSGAIVLGGPDNDIYLLDQNGVIRRYDHAGTLLGTYAMGATSGFILTRYDADLQRFYWSATDKIGVFDCANNLVVGLLAPVSMFSSAFSNTNDGFSLDTIRRIVATGNDTDGVTFYQL